MNVDESNSRIPLDRATQSADGPSAVDVVSPLAPSTIDVHWIHEYGLAQKLSTLVRCF